MLHTLLLPLNDMKRSGTITLLSICVQCVTNMATLSAAIARIDLRDQQTNAWKTMLNKFLTYSKISYITSNLST